MSDPAVTAFLTKVLCSHGGRLERNRLADLLELPEEQIEQILQDERLRFPQNSQLVLAQSALRICSRYLHPQGCEDEESCPKLHLCRHYLRGQCPHNRRPPCRFSHDVQSDHNRAVLKANEVIGLNEDEIKVLLFQNDNQLLPEECRNYREDNCGEGEDCLRIHVCGYFIRGDCRNRFCKRSHNLLESKLLLTRSWLSQEALENFQMLCALKYMGKHQALRDEPRNEGPRDARGMSRGRGRGKPGYRRRTGSQDLLDSREKRNEGSQFRWRSSSRPPSQCSMSQRSGDEGYNDSDSSSDHGYPKTKLENLMDDWFAPNTSQPGKARSSAGVTPQEGTRSIPVTKTAAKSASAIKPLMLQTPAQPMEPLNYRSSSELTKTSNNTMKVDYGSSNAASVTPAPLMKTYQPYIHAPYSKVPPALPVSSDSEIFSAKKPSIPNQKPDIEPRKTLSSLMTRLSVAPVTPPASSSITSITQPKPAPRTVYGHMGSSLSSSSIIASVGADTSSGKLQASVKPIIQTETKSKAKYSPTDEDFEFLCLPPKATSSTLTQPQPANSASSVSPGKSSQQQITEICHANLWKYCDLGGKCTKMHYYLPYRWQLFNGIDWDDLPNMEDIERAYCDPKTDRYQLIDFQAMKSGFKSVRRLTTPSSVTQPSEYVLSTEWRWYWKNEYGIWAEYGKLSRENMNATILSSDLESIYLSDPTGTIPFFAENQSYCIDCQEMKQRNSYFMTEREVRRRPKFLDFQNVKMLRGSTRSATDSIQQTQPESHLINRIYTPQQDMEVQKIGYTKILLSQNSREFTKIVAMFSNTISDHSVKNIWQIQNSVLWERYNRLKDQMKSKNLSSTVNERQLFHGTYLANIDAICRESFDWRICGTNGVEYGQGSYFTRDALYAHKYSSAGSLGTQTMFVARVLVGDFIKGNPTLRRPPQKYGSSETYDSCVDNVYNPSVFVVFEKQQAYPEFMVEYEERKSPCIVN